MRRPRFGQVLGVALVAVIVVVSGWTDVDRYFNKQMHDASVFAEYSAGPTFAGRALAELPRSTRVLMDERLVGEPSVKFLAPNAPKLEDYETHLLPLTEATDTALFLGGDQTADADYVKRLYPNATIETFSPPYGGPVLLHEALVSAADVASIQGLKAEYQPAGGGGGVVNATVPSLDLTWDQAPAPLPFTARFSGALDAPAYGDYGFQVEGAAKFELRIDRQAVAVDGTPVQVSLARGMHHLELDATVTDPGQPLRLLWRPPSASELAPVPRSNLFSSPTVETGLLGHYYPNGDWTGPESLEEVDPFVAVYFQVPPLPMPFSVEWTGQIATPIAGIYRFNSTSIDSSEIDLDGNHAPKETPVSLTAGLHDIRLRYEAHSGHNHVELRWQPPGRDWEIVPSEFLFPSKSVGEAQPLPALPAGAASTTSTSAPAQPAKLLTPVWQLDLRDGSLPAGIALDHDGSIYVADAGRKALSKLDADGRVLWTASVPAASGSQQLAAVAVAADGSALVLDGESGVISRFTPGGQYAGAVAKDLALYHPRGLAAGPNGDIYVADTGGSRALRLSADGQQLGQVGMRGKDRAGLDQPTGIAVTSAGDVLLADPSAQKIVRFGPSGAFASEWGFDSGPTVNGPQLALGPDGAVWASDPLGASLQEFSPDGQPLGRYAPDGGLDQPSGFAVGDGYVVVAEPGAKRVRKLALPA